MRIGNRIQAFESWSLKETENGTIRFEWYHFQFPSVTSIPYFKVTIFSTSNNSTMTQDKAIQCHIDRKSYDMSANATFSDFE